MLSFPSSVWRETRCSMAVVRRAVMPVQIQPAAMKKRIVSLNHYTFFRLCAARHLGAHSFFSVWFWLVANIYLNSAYAHSRSIWKCTECSVWLWFTAKNTITLVCARSWTIIDAVIPLPLSVIKTKKIHTSAIHVFHADRNLVEPTRRQFVLY